MKVNQILMVLLIPVFVKTVAQNNELVWNGKKCAVALTYDDGLNVHLDRVIPELDSAGFKGTFYLVGIRPGVSQRINDWRLAAVHGHELGNHSLFHPCAAVLEDRDYSSWVLHEYDLNYYTITRIVDEIKMANIFLKAIDGKDKRTIAYPCGDFSIKDSSYIPAIRGEIIGGRNGTNVTEIGKIDVYRIAAVAVNDNFSAEQLIDLVKNAMSTKSLLAFLFHGVGGEHNTNISAVKHSELIRFIKENEKEIWVAPMVEIAEFITDYQNKMN